MLTILYTPRFAKEFKKLPRRVQEQVLEKEQTFRKDPFDPRLRTHKLHGDLSNYWSYSVDYSTRIIFSFEGKSTVRLQTVGGHEIY